MTEKIKDFCNEVCSYVNHATPEEKAEITQELQDHLEDHAQALMELGRSEEEARQSALKAMGSAREIGQELNKEFPLLWLLLSRIPGFLIGILVALLIISPSYLSIYHAYNNLQARIAPEERFLAQDGRQVDYFFDIRREIPNSNDIVRFYGSTVYSENGEYYALIGSCCYDKWIFGYASDNAHRNVRLLSDDEFSHGGGGFANVGTSFTLDSVAVEYGQEYVEAVYDRFGTSWQAEIPLNWEGIA